MKSCGEIVVDSPFGRGLYPFLVKSSQDEKNAEFPEDLNEISQATSFRRAAEWVMRIFQGFDHRMKDNFLYEE